LDGQKNPKELLLQIFTVMAKNWDEVDQRFKSKNLLGDDERSLIHNIEELEYMLLHLFTLSNKYPKSAPDFFDALPLSLVHLLGLDLSYIGNSYGIEHSLNQYCLEGANSSEEKLEKIKILKEYLPDLLKTFEFISDDH
jgi:hypothetical protein